MVNRLDPDQARHVVGPDLGPNCLQRFLVDDKTPGGALSQSNSSPGKEGGALRGYFDPPYQAKI